MDVSDDENLGNVNRAIGRNRSMEEDPVVGRLPGSLDWLIGDFPRKLGIVSKNLRIWERFF